ncbi:MAG: hypothetical protein ACHP7I_01285 [Terriglobales bacterium]
MATPAPIPSPHADLDTACLAIVNHRRRPLLVLYYPASASMTENDIADAYQELRIAGWSREHPIPQLDLLVHTTGGDPVAAYRLAQAVRSLSQEMDVLVPEYAYSAGTLLSFAGDSIRLGDYAGLSPIDITLTEPSNRSAGGVQLASVDSFIEFTKKVRQTVEQMLAGCAREGISTTVDSDLLVQMVKEVGALKVGKYYRERTLTGHYAEVLLDSYMFRDETDAKDRRNQVIEKFLFSAPSHDLHLDYHLCADWHLKMEQMQTDESDICKAAIETLGTFTDNGMICQKLNRKRRMPFIKFYDNPPVTAPAPPAPAPAPAPTTT